MSWISTADTPDDIQRSMELAGVGVLNSRELPRTSHHPTNDSEFPDDVVVPESEGPSPVMPPLTNPTS